MTTPTATPRLGISGRLARTFQNHPLTPILALSGLLLGLFAVLVTPREEEPQIDVTMANVLVPFAGASVADVENLVSYPLEKVLSEIDGVKHVYSVSRPGLSVATVEFNVGVPRQQALVRLYNQVYSKVDWLPAGLGVGQPLVRPMGIDDVPVMGVTLWTDDSMDGGGRAASATAADDSMDGGGRAASGTAADDSMDGGGRAASGTAAADSARSPVDLAAVAHTLETELKRVRGTRDVYTIGAPERAVIVTVDATKLAAFHLTVADLSQALAAANGVILGERVTSAGQRPLAAGQFLADAGEIADLVIGVASGQPVTLTDVATISAGADLPIRYAWFGAPNGRAGPALGIAPAVTIAIAKQPGSNAADITTAIARRLETLKDTLIPAGVHTSITRDYGDTANQKALKLIEKLIFATLAVVLLVLATLGWRAAIVVGGAVVITLALTLFASWAMGFTINRVSLFALIFSIGILVDDAIVIVENIHRHQRQSGGHLIDLLPQAVDEVGSPTILATLTVIAALLPMAFVSGLMGPYLRPIPINAAAGMLLSLAVALVVTPWLALKLFARPGDQSNAEAATTRMADKRQRLFERLLRPFLSTARGQRRRQLWVAIAIALALSVGLVMVKAVVLKMLPFDNKSEFQVVVDLPEGSTLERTNALLLDLAAVVASVPEVSDYQGYAGTAAPINFNGLVRQYYLRSGANVGELQVNLVNQHLRQRKSHQIARELRPQLAALGRRYDASVKVVEVPPGPPVLAPLVAEIYGPNPEQTRAVANELRQLFTDTAGIVDVDSSVEAAAERDLLIVDRSRAAHLGVSQSAIVATIEFAVSGTDSSYLRDGRARYAVPIRLRLAAADQASNEQLLATRVRAAAGQLVPLSELVKIETRPWENVSYHKDLLPVVYVTGDEAGRYDSPLYGMATLAQRIASQPWSGQRWSGQPLTQTYFAPPTSDANFALKWDGEWQITFETFRDMGLAYSVGLLLIYLLLVAQFGSYAVPLIIMAPIPLTVIGVMPGHALLGAQFTATSMIGMIALAGIIVRNSILLVDFINHAIAAGKALDAAVIEACAVRAQPIALTAVAAIAGALFILDDPIFNGLAIALIFGILVSTALTLIVIPVLYHRFLSRSASGNRC